MAARPLSSCGESSYPDVGAANMSSRRRSLPSETGLVVPSSRFEPVRARVNRFERTMLVRGFTSTGSSRSSTGCQADSADAEPTVELLPRFTLVRREMLPVPVTSGTSDELAAWPKSRDDGLVVRWNALAGTVVASLGAIKGASGTAGWLVRLVLGESDSEAALELRSLAELLAPVRLAAREPGLCASGPVEILRLGSSSTE